MKQAYISLVTVVRGHPDGLADDIARVDELLNDSAREHEIVLGLLGGRDTFRSEFEDLSRELSGPLVVMFPAVGTSVDEAMWEGLARASGDFVLEWDANLDQVDGLLVADLLSSTDGGAELIAVLPKKPAVLTRVFYRFANWLRPGRQRMHVVVARMISRRVLSDVLSSPLTSAGAYRVVAFSQEHLPRHQMIVDLEAGARPGLAERVGESIDILITGTRVASRLPTLFAVFFALTGVAAMIWAIVFYLRGGTPEGWTTILVFLGFATSGIFIVLALLSGQIRIAARSGARSSWTTFDVFGATRFEPPAPTDLGDSSPSSDSEGGP